MTQAEAQTRDLLNAIADQPTTLTFSGNDYLGLKGATIYPDNFVEGGMLKDYDCTILTSVQVLDDAGNFNDRFSTDPANGDTFTVDGVVLEIIKITTDSLGVAIQFDMQNAVK